MKPTDSLSTPELANRFLLRLQEDYHNFPGIFEAVAASIGDFAYQRFRETLGAERRDYMDERAWFRMNEMREIGIKENRKAKSK